MNHSLKPLPAVAPATGFRATLNRHPILTAGLVLSLASVCVFWSFHPRPSAKSYYSDDDGATFFAETTQLPPFTRDGKEAVGAMVYRCDENGEPFVGYLYRYTPDGKARTQAMLDRHRGGPPIGMEVKRPGAGEWVPAMDHRPPKDGTTLGGSEVTRIRCPGGHGIPTMINPKD